MIQLTRSSTRAIAQAKAGWLSRRTSVRPPSNLVPGERRPHVVVVGGGFGGINVAKGLSKAPVRITLIDQHNYHLFQPLLYQVATASLSPSDIASPIRSILRRQGNVSVVLAKAVGVGPKRREVLLDDGEATEYDILVLATGTQPAYFGHPEWAEIAPGLKDIDDAVVIRRRVFEAFERAERNGIEHGRKCPLTFVIVGGGPTGVELAGSIGEIAHYTLSHDFRTIDPRDTRIMLIDGGERILSGFPPRLSRRAERDLQRLGVEVRTKSRVTRIGQRSIWLGDEEVETDAVLWAAGVSATPIATTLGVPLDGGGRVIVEPDLTIPRYPNIFVIGDVAAMTDDVGEPLPGTAPVAIQAAQSTVENIQRHLNGQHSIPFSYRDRGMMATVGRGRAVAVIGGRTFDGFVAWTIWAVVHIWSLIEFRSRLAVMLQWAWAYISRQRSSRLITGDADEHASEPLHEGAPEIRTPSQDNGASVDQSLHQRIATVGTGRNDSDA